MTDEHFAYVEGVSLLDKLSVFLNSLAPNKETQIDYSMWEEVNQLSIWKGNREELDDYIQIHLTLRWDGKTYVGNDWKVSWYLAWQNRGILEAKDVTFLAAHRLLEKLSFRDAGL